MNYDSDPLIRVCTPCLEGTSTDNNFVQEVHHEDVRCIYCKSYDTVEQAPKWRWFKCNNCNKIFRRL